MQEGNNKIYLYKYFYALIMFLGILTLPFLILSFENEHNKALEEYNDAVTYAVSEEFSPQSRNVILGLQKNLEIAKVDKYYKTFVSMMMIIIFLSLFNYLYIKVGIKYKTINNTPNIDLNKKLIIIVSIVEILYFSGLVIFASSEYIGIHFWTLFFVNLIIVIFVIVLLLQIQYLIKSKSEE